MKNLELIKIEEVIEILGKKRGTIYKYIKKNIIPPSVIHTSSITRRIFFDKRKIERVAKKLQPKPKKSIKNAILSLENARRKK